LEDTFVRARDYRATGDNDSFIIKQLVGFMAKLIFNTTRSENCKWQESHERTQRTPTWDPRT